MTRIQPISPLAGAALVLGAWPTAYAAGFQVNEQSALHTGRASASTATVKDPSAVWHNPAGLTFIEGTAFQAGLNLIRGQAVYRGPGLRSTNPSFPEPRVAGGEELDVNFVPIPNAYAGRALSSKAFVGLGLYAPYGLGLKWDDPERFSGRTSVQEINLRTFFITPAIALRLTDHVAVAVGVSLVPATVYLKRTLAAPDNGEVLFPADVYGREATVELSGSAFGVGATAGVILTFLDHLKIGAAFRSAVDLSFSGDANFDLPETVPAEVRANFPDQEGTADLTLPHTFQLGIGWDQGDFLVELGGQLTLWSAYDELRLNFSTGRPSASSATPKNWNPVPLIRLGAQYNPIEALALRAGVAFDWSPVPTETVDPTLPDRNRLVGSIGAGYAWGWFRVDAAWMVLYFVEREIENSITFPIRAPGDDTPHGTYADGLVHVLSLSAGFQL